MKRGQKNKKTGIFSEFFMTRKEGESYIKERFHLTKKKDCPMLKHREQSFLVKWGHSLEQLLTFFLAMKKFQSSYFFALFSFK
jgi:hypothetical protein